MRERKSFAERTKVLTTTEAKKKFFLVYEGAMTEGIYFDAVNNRRTQLAINPLIELVPLVRSYSEEGWSNPKKILDRVISEIEAETTGEITCEMMLNRIMDYFVEEGINNSTRTSKRIIWNYLSNICNVQLGYELKDIVKNTKEDCEVILKSFCKDFKLPKIIEDISKIMLDKTIGYEVGFDKICLVVDRDRESFTEEQYDSVLAECESRDFDLYISNPCFEFWLLLHFNEVLALDKAQLQENPRVSKKKRYTEVELSKLLPRYSKSSYDAESLMSNVDLAIQNEKSFCEDIGLLKEQVGSNVGMLLVRLRESNKTAYLTLSSTIFSSEGDDNS